MSGSALLTFDLDERRPASASALAPLTHALTAELEPWLARELPIPAFKSRLTKVGGWCPNEGAMLQFDPTSPHAHTCPVCGNVQSGIEHDQYWAMGAQLWTAERAAQSAALHAITRNDAHRTLALRVIEQLTTQYETWPNRDNVLGPSRPFFSTYLESIWLLNLCHCIALLECETLAENDRRILDAAREKIVQPSSALIATYNEGLSNRQVWNEVAILSAMRVLNASRSIETRLEMPGGLFDLLAHGLLADGTWYEGENYHLFAHRGLWYGMELLRVLDRPVPESLREKFVRGFATPFLGLLPDDTLASRRDSKYAVSIRQWRFAEWCELGSVHALRQVGSNSSVADVTTANTLGALLGRLYDNSIARIDTGRWRSTADAERSERATALSRADLSWRALLAMPTTPIATGSFRLASVCLPNQGLAVIRRDGGQTYVALEGGHTGGGHGHPDRLALTLQHANARWLEDPGTASYVSTSLHWYRSTLAHAAPLVNGRSQQLSPATLVAFEDGDSAGWMTKRAELADGVTVQRTIVVCDDYLVDLLEWFPSSSTEASKNPDDKPTTIDLPIARDAYTSLTNWHQSDPNGAGGVEDGFNFLRGIECAALNDRAVELTIPGHAPHDAPVRETAHAWYASSEATELWRARAPGPPECADRDLHWLRATSNSGRIFGVIAWSNSIEDVALDARGTHATVIRRDKRASIHSRSENGWQVTTESASGGDQVVLTRALHPALQLEAAVDSEEHTHDVKYAGLLLDVPESNPLNVDIRQPGAKIQEALQHVLGKSNYRQTEKTWQHAGSPTAYAQFIATSTHLIVDVATNTGAPVVPPSTATNSLDNERLDVNADGVQLYIGDAGRRRWSASWLLVPALESAPSARVTTLTPDSPSIEATWARTEIGWAMRIAIPRSELPFTNSNEIAFNLVVNERTPDRERRSGQLALAAGGGFAYLRGDREDAENAARLRIGKRKS